MTGFGSAEREGFKVEIRSLNHRYLDVNVRMPSALNAHELPLRARAKERIARGKVDITVSYTGSSALGLRLDMPAAKAIHTMLNGLSEALELSSEKVGLSHMLYFKDNIVTSQELGSFSHLHEAFEEALEILCGMRAREGAGLLDEMLAMTEKIAGLNEKVTAGAPAAIAARRNAYMQRIAELLSQSPVDEQRLMMEATQYAERADITEEITRIRHHAEHMSEMLRAGGTVGRKLDFLLQELNREANTIGSKTDDPGLIDCVIEMKTEIERAREQVQNVQ